MLSSRVEQGNVADETVRAHVANACEVDIDAIEAYAIVVFKHLRPGAHELGITSNLSGNPDDLGRLLTMALRATDKVAKSGKTPEKGDRIHAGLPATKYSRYRQWRFRNFGF